MKINGKTIIWSLVSVILVVLLMFGLIYWQRNHIIEHIAKDKFAKIEQSKNIKISFSQMKLEGLGMLVIDSLKIQEKDEKPFVSIERLECNLNLFNMLKREVVINKMHVKGIKLNAINQYGKKNYDFLLKKKSIANNTATETKKKSIFEQITDKINTFFETVPDDLTVTDMDINLIHNNYSVNLDIPEFNVIDNDFNSIARLKCNGSEPQQMKLKGNFESTRHIIKCNVSSADTSLLHIPFIDSLYNAKIKGRELQFSFETTEKSNNDIQLKGDLGFTDLHVDYFRISDNELAIGDGSIDYRINVNKNSFELDSSSTVKFNKLSFNPYIKVDLAPSLKVTVSTNKECFPSQDLFGSIPQGLFVNLDSIKTEGDLDFHFFFQADADSIDNLKFNSELKKHPNFKIVKFGHTDFRKINNPFTYEATDHGTPVRKLEIGSKWNNFRPLDSISPHLQNAVMISEDGFFYSHKGFYEGAFQYSLIQNIKQRRFARGGSTISMQLVKNVFLNNNKTLMRKLEEIMIVWLIENEHLVSKKRLYEIYLNIIEWGPNHAVYGAEEAAQFYFNKHAHQLTIEESIYLATIVPSPKKFMYKFDEEHKLRAYMDSYYKLIGGKMVSRGYITAETYEGLSKDNVRITGKAVNWLPKLKVAVPDSLSIDEGESLLNLDEE